MHSLDIIRKNKRTIFLIVLFSYASVTCQFFFKEFCHLILHAKDYVLMEQTIHSSHSHGKTWDHKHDKLDLFFQIIENEGDRSEELPSNKTHLKFKNIVHLPSKVLILDYKLIVKNHCFSWKDATSVDMLDIKTPPPQA